jgi:tellurite resistance protein TehA-like permease
VRAEPGELASRPFDPLGFLRVQIAALSPGLFALVMATGIISNAYFFEGPRAVSDALFAINVVAFCWLSVMTVLRLSLFGPTFWADLVDPRQVFGFFTVVAGSSVLGAGMSLRALPAFALALWLFALVLWFGLIYLGFGVLALRNRTGGADIVHGGWLIAIVGTEALVILGAIVAPALGEVGRGVFVLIHMLWGVGLGLYGLFIVLFAQRIFFSDVSPDDLTPVLWIVMGAAAITTNAGSTLILTSTGIAFLNSMRPFIDGVTLIVWAWATWWIPLLLLFGVWKHGIRRVPLRYTPLLWGLVFPIGMYSVATAKLSLATDFPTLQVLSRAIMWIALAVWLATAIGFAVASWRRLRDGTRFDELRPA